MARFLIFQRLVRYGPVEIGKGRNRDGKSGYVASCTADDCGWSGQFATYSAVCLAAKGHRCRITTQDR
ncbi:mobile element transfer protein [Streptomyces sp. NPDC020096]